MTAAVAYPPEPWHLRGQMHVSVFLVPAETLSLQLGPSWRVFTVGRRAVVATAWVSYEPGGVLTYRELMATVLVRRGLRILPTIASIWVDNPASRDGGRELWAIPKELARFDWDGSAHAARTPDAFVASGTVRSRVRLPLRWPLRFSIVQWQDGAEKITRVRATAAIRVDEASFEPDPRGPLGFLAGRRPWLSLTLRDFELQFGQGSH